MTAKGDWFCRWCGRTFRFQICIDRHIRKVHKIDPNTGRTL